MLSKLSGAAISALAATFLVADAGNAQPSENDIRECVKQRQREFQQPTPFEKGDVVTCEQAFMYDDWGDWKLPECRGKSNSKTISYTPGLNREIDTATVVVDHNDNGNHSLPKFGFSNNGAETVSVDISCESKPICPGGPGAKMEVRIKGTYINRANNENIFQWTLECTRELL